MAFRMTIGHPRPRPGYPRHAGLVSASCTSNPRFRHQLSSDPASRRAPLPRRMVPVITVHKGLTPLESATSSVIVPAARNGILANIFRPPMSRLADYLPLRPTPLVGAFLPPPLLLPPFPLPLLRWFVCGGRNTSAASSEWCRVERVLEPCAAIIQAFLPARRLHQEYLLPIECVHRPSEARSHCDQQ